MAESEIYEDAESKVLDPSKNTHSLYQDAQSKINNLTKRKTSKGNESSSIYQDAQSKIVNNSPNKQNKYNNPFPKAGRERNDIELKKEFIKNNLSYDEYEEEINNNNNNLKEKEIKYNHIDIYNNNDNKENINYNNEDKENQSEYYEPEASNYVKNPTLFEGASQKSECCNLPKCVVF